MKVPLAPIGAALTGLILAIGACVALSYFCLEPVPIPTGIKTTDRIVPMEEGEHSVLIKNESYNRND